MRGKQYKDKLDFKSAAKGIKLANENAESLIQDAELLFKNKRFERSVALSILSIEESGKPSIIRSILLADDQKELKKEWQNYRRHTAKNLTWISPELIFNGARKLEDFRDIFDKGKDHGQVLDNLKQLSLYTDIFSKRKWSIPKDIIDEELAKGILSVAKIMSKNKSDGINSELGLQLWVKHLKPVRNLEFVNMKQALINCYNEAEEMGIIEKGKTNEMIDFLL